MSIQSFADQNLELLSDLLGTLDEAQNTIGRLDAQYEGKAPISYLSTEARSALGSRLTALSSNLPRLAVTALAERMRVQGFRVGGVRSVALEAAWSRNDLDQMSPVLHREALALGRGYVMVWADEKQRARVSIESAHQMAVIRDPASRAITAAVKRWEDGQSTHALLMLPEYIYHYRSAHLVSGGSVSGYQLVAKQLNPLDTVPVVEFRNGDRLLSQGVSEMADVLPLSDALTKLLSDLMVGSEYYARPRRWATGIELVEAPDGSLRNPFPEGDRMMVSEAAEAKFGSLPASDLASYREAVDILMSQIMAVSALPAHYVGITTANPASADANRSAEASLTTRAEARQGTFGPAWEQVARLILAVEGNQMPSSYDVSVLWNDPATRSIAQEADAVVKLYQSGLLPQSYALSRLGYSEEEITRIRAAARMDSIDKVLTVGDGE